MIETEPKPTDVVQFAWFFVHPQVGPHYSAPLNCNPNTPEGCLRELATQGRFTERPAGLLTWEKVWFEMEMLPKGEARPPAEVYDGFAPVVHPATGNIMAVLLRKRVAKPPSLTGRGIAPPPAPLGDDDEEYLYGR